MTTRRYAALAAILLCGAGLLTACGGDDEGGGGGGDTVSASSFASDVCSAVGDWAGGIQEESQQISSAFQSGSPEEGKQILEDFIGGAVDRTDDLIAEVEEAGVPDVDGGEEYADQLRDAFEAARNVLADVQAEAADLPSDPQAFGQAAQELGSGVQEALGAVGESVEQPDSPELEEAFEEEEACASAPF